MTQNRDIIKGIKGKTIAKKVGCGILVGAIAISNIVPFRLFTNTDIIVNAATSTVKTGVDRYASRTGTFVSKYLPNMDGGENFKLETVNYVQQIVAITDSKGNKYSADLINLQYKDSSAYSQYAARHYIPCLVNLKFVSSTNSSITEAVIPDSWSVVINGETKIVPILEIGDYAFSNSNLKTITIPSSVIQIADYGFSDARSLENVYFMDEDGTIKTNGENLVYVGNYAFSGCSNLKTAYLPKQLIEATMCSDTEEGGSENEFYASSNNYYTSDTTNYVGAGGKFGTNVYRDCISLENIEIDGKNIEIPANTFAGCKGIKNIQFSNNVKNALLRMSCFAGLDSLKDLTINCNVVLESYVFANEINLNSIAFNGEVKETEYRSSLSNSGALGLFSGSFTNVTDGTVMFNIPKTVNGDEVSLVLPESCFSGTTGLKNVVFSNNIKNLYVKPYAFSNAGLESIDLEASYIALYPLSLGGLSSNVKTINFESDNLDITTGSFATIIDSSGITTTNGTTSSSLKDNLYITKVNINSETTKLNNSGFFLLSNGKTLSYAVPTGIGTGCLPFEGLGNKCSLVFGSKAKVIEGYMYGCGKISSIYFTSPYTDIKSNAVFTTDASSPCTIYGFTDTTYYTKVSDAVKSNIFKNYKIDKYVTSLSVDVVYDMVNTNEFDGTGIEVYAALSDGSSKLLKYSSDGKADGYTISDASKIALEETKGLNIASKVNLVIDYFGTITSAVVQVVPKSVIDFDVSLKNDVSFVEGNTVSSEMFEISNVVHNDGAVEEIALNPEKITVKLKSGNEQLSKGTNIVVVSYKGVDKEIGVIASEKQVEKLEVTLKDKKFYPGDTLVSDDFTVIAIYNNGEIVENFKDFTLSGNTIAADAVSDSKQVVRISSGDTTAEISVIISKLEASMLLATYSDTTIFEGDSVSKAKVIVTVVYNNGTMRQLDTSDFELVYSPIVADKENEIKVVLVENMSITTSILVTGQKRAASDVVPVPTNTMSPTDLINGTNQETNEEVKDSTPSPTDNIIQTEIPDNSIPSEENPNGGIAISQPSTEASSGKTQTEGTEPTSTPGVSTTESPMENEIPSISVTKLSATSYKLGNGEKVTISLTGGKAVKFESSNTNVATVTSKGAVMAKKVGMTTINVTDEFGTVKKVKIIVKKAPTAKTFKASVTTKTLSVGKAFTLKPKFKIGYYSNRITFTSSKKTIASVTKAGVVKGKKAGKTIITMKTFNGKKVKVTVKVK